MGMGEIGSICNRVNNKGSLPTWHGSVGCGPMNQGISGSISGQGTCPGWGLLAGSLALGTVPPAPSIFGSAPAPHDPWLCPCSPQSLTLPLHRSNVTGQGLRPGQGTPSSPQLPAPSLLPTIANSAPAPGITGSTPAQAQRLWPRL